MSDTLQAGTTARDFDFLMGSWHVANRRLKRRLAGSDDWEEFAATAVAQPILDGFGNQDVLTTDHDGAESSVGDRLKPVPHADSSFRFFDPERQRWSIYWADSRRPGELDPPLFGHFDGEAGVFHGEDVFRGRPILVRFIWSGVTTPTPRWEQAFSDDGGRTWETNWVMDFTPAEGGGE